MSEAVTLRARWMFAVASLLFLVGCHANQLVLHPSTSPAASIAESLLIPRSSGAKALQVLSFRTEGCGNQPAKAIVLVFGGNEDRAEWTAASVANIWRPFPVEIVAMNYPGYGESTGPASLDELASAARDLFDVVRRRSGTRPVFIHANSLGTSVALSVAANRPVAGLVLQNPAPLRRILLWWFGPMNLWLATGRAAAEIPPELITSDSAARCVCPAVFIIAGADLLSPPWMQRGIANQFPGPRKTVFLPWAPHNAQIEGEKLDELRGRIGWMWRRNMAK